MTESGLAAHRVRQALRSFLAQKAEAGDKVVLGVSGGADSLAMACAAAEIADELAMEFVPVIVDHQLQSGSGDVARRAVEQCQSLGLSASRIRTVDVVLGSGDGLEAAARDARYAALHAVAAEVGARGIAVAHTMEDQAETVLLRLARGSGSRAIAAMQPVTGEIWRPLLRLDRQTLRLALTHFGLEAYEDAHNTDPRFLRSRVRHELMPLLREVLGHDIEAGLAKTADLVGEDADALDASAANIYKYSVLDGELDCSGFGPIPAAITRRVVRLWLLDQGASAAGLSRLHIEAVHRLGTDRSVSGPVKVVGGIEVSLVSGRLRALK